MISTIAASIFCFNSRIRSRICAWIVTSSAVVGSSAISSFGLQASAIAIITRCRMPPDSWCGYSPMRRCGLRDVHEAQHVDGPVERRLAVEPLVQGQRLGDLPADRQHRVQRGHRLLEDHRDLVAAHLAHLGFAEVEQVAPGETDRAGDDAAGRRRRPAAGSTAP